MNDYPLSVNLAEIDATAIDPAVLAAACRFAKARPWRGTIAERKMKFRAAAQDICAAAGLPAPRIVFGVDERTASGRSCCIASLNTIILRGRLSVVTLLHEIGHLLVGASEKRTVYWSLAVFKAAFPRSFGRLTFDGHIALARRHL